MLTSISHFYSVDRFCFNSFCLKRCSYHLALMRSMTDGIKERKWKHIFMVFVLFGLVRFWWVWLGFVTRPTLEHGSFLRLRKSAVSRGSHFILDRNQYTLNAQFLVPVAEYRQLSSLNTVTQHMKTSTPCRQRYFGCYGKLRLQR